MKHSVVEAFINELTEIDACMSLIEKRGAAVV